MSVTPPEPTPAPARRPPSFARQVFPLLAIGAAALLAIALGIRYSMMQLQLTHVSRVNADLHSLARALDEYKTAHGEYPPMRPVGDWVSTIPPHPTDRPEAPLTSAESRLHLIEPGGTDLAGLTTPVAFATSLWHDPLARIRSLPYLYHTDGRHYLIFSAGPDRDYDIDPTRDVDFATSQPSPLLLARIYDPTNGSLSDGDLLRLNP